MEITQLNTINYSDNFSSNNTSIKNNDIQNIIKNYPEDKIEIEQDIKPSNLLENISSSTSQLANLQKLQSNLSTQLELTSEIVKTTTLASNSSSEKLDDKQPIIKKHMDDFNLLSDRFQKPEISDEIGIYFDGKVGSKPLNSHQILDATAEQNERLHKYQQDISKEIDLVVEQHKNTIESEETTVNFKVEFKTTDYSKISEQFNSSSLQNIEGNLLDSQANAFPLHSEKLLA
jgi:hypothetical protein